MKRAEYALELGQGNGLAVLNAKVDIQRDSVNLLNALLNLETEKRNLNVAMGREANIEFQIEKDNRLSNVEALESLISKAKDENISIRINRQNLLVNEYNIDLINAENKPTVTSGLSYNLAYSDNAAGAFITQSSSNSLAGNIGVNWTIFDGTRSIRRQNAVLNLTNQKLQIDQLEQQVERDVINAWKNYQNDLFVIGVQENALKTNQENFDRTEEQFRSGQVSSIEFRQAQLNLINAQFSLTNAKYSAKIREVQLNQLIGNIIE
jgi:outer membrane protein TolC